MGVNLLPPEHKSTVLYARRNTFLLRWIIGSSVGLIVIASIMGLGLWYINHNVQAQDKQIASLKQHLSSQKQSETEKKAASISNNFKLTLKVLQQQIFFSKLLVKVGEVMPKNTSLEGLTITSEQNTIDLSVVAKDYQSATQVQINITDPGKKLFDKADIINVTCANEGEFPCKITLRAVFAKDSGLKYKTTGAKK